MIDLFKKMFKRYYWMGSEFTCPICNNSTRSLRSIGRKNLLLSELQVFGAGERNKGCPICGSTDKERLLYLYLKNLFKTLNKNTRVLHVAPEEPIKKILKENYLINYTAGDYFASGYNYSSDVMHLNIEQTDFLNDSFDIVICCHVLEHVNDDNKAINEIHRILSNNGIAILQVPISLLLDNTLEIKEFRSENLNNILYGQEDHLRLYGKDYFTKIKNAGFEVIQEQIKNANNFGIESNEFIIVARKL
jgi:SAM-dependent methyltransferase